MKKLVSLSLLALMLMIGAVSAGAATKYLFATSDTPLIVNGTAKAEGSQVSAGSYVSVNTQIFDHSKGGWAVGVPTKVSLNTSDGKSVDGSVYNTNSNGFTYAGATVPSGFFPSGSRVYVSVMVLENGEWHFADSETSFIMQ